MRIKRTPKIVRKYIGSYKLLAFCLGIALISLVLDLLGTKHNIYRTVSHILVATTCLGVSGVIAWRMIEKVRYGAWGVDILALIAIVTAVILRQYWAAIIIVIMYLGGDALEDYAEKKATSSLKHLLARAPQTATVLRGRKSFEVKASQVQKGDKLLISPGDIIPVDCFITEGSTSVDESSLTGESVPVSKMVGDDLLSGSVNIEGSLTVRTLRSAADSQYQQIIKLVDTATGSQAPFVRLADRFAIPFTVISLAIAGGVWYASGSALRFLEVIVVATPCPLILGAPIAFIGGMNLAARRGIVVKRGSVLEHLAILKTLAFDKTGTLTAGVPKVSEVVSLDKNWSKPKIVQLAASVEQRSNHILAESLLAEAKLKSLKLFNTRGLTEHAGQGLSALVGKQQILVGKLGFLSDAGVTIKKAPKTALTTTYVAVDGELIGAISFSDTLRAESGHMLQNLKSIGVARSLMVTGDNKATAERIAHELGISDVHAECLPASKVEIIEQLPKNYRPVGFVGDGVNDAPVLAAADVGIALGARGSTAASESADAVILHDDIGKVSESVAISKRTLSIAKQTILIGMGLSFGLMAIFATGKFKPAMGAALQEVVDVAVILYALRARRG